MLEAWLVLPIIGALCVVWFLVGFSFAVKEEGR
jgi:hypothetical protein